MFDSLSLYYYVMSLVLAGLIFYIKKIHFISPPGLFILFALLYSTFPYLAHIEVVPSLVGSLSLFQRSDLIEIHLINVGSSILAFIFPYIFYHRKKGKSQIGPNKIEPVTFDILNNRDMVILIGYAVISTLVVILGKIYPWGGWGGGGVEFPPRPSLINSILGHGKLIMSLIIIYFAVFYKKTKLIFILLIPFIFAVIVEGSRTSLAITFLTLLLLWSKDRKSDYLETLKISSILLLSIGFLVFIAFYRMGAEATSLEIFDLLYPVYFEGMYGSYMCLQIYDLITVSKVLSPTFATHIVLDPLIFLIPRFIFVAMGLDKDSFTLYNNFGAMAESYLAEPLGPYGGFYYVADAHLAFPYVGPFVFSLLFGWITALLEHKSTSNTTRKLFFYIYLASFFITFIKHQISQSIHFLFVAILFYFLLHNFLNIASRYRKQYAATMSTP